MQDIRRSFCHFNVVYFEKAASVNDGVSIAEARLRLGRELAKIEPLKGKLDNSYLVVPAPMTAIRASEEYAKELGIDHRMAIEKSDFSRGFINSPSERRRIMDGAYTVHDLLVRGKKIILVDDSIVRGETMKRLIMKIRKADASEVHVRLTEPPIRYPCFYGIDFPNPMELISNKVGNDIEKGIAKAIGADSVSFQTIEGLVRAIGLNENELCLACLNADYPTEYGVKRYNEAKSKFVKLTKGFKNIE
jgi:amidophosphoribosyltransferase